MPAAAADTRSSDTCTAGYLAVAWLTACSSVSCAWEGRAARSSRTTRARESFTIFSIALDELAEQFANLTLRGRERPAPRRCGAVHAPHRLSVALRSGFQIPFPFEAVQDRIERSQAEFVAVARQLFGHAQSEDRLLGRVMQDVQADQPRVQVPVRHVLLGHRRISPSIVDIELRYYKSVSKLSNAQSTPRPQRTNQFRSLPIMWKPISSQ